MAVHHEEDTLAKQSRGIPREYSVLISRHSNECRVRNVTQRHGWAELHLGAEEADDGGISDGDCGRHCREKSSCVGPVSRTEWAGFRARGGSQGPGIGAVDRSHSRSALTRGWNTLSTHGGTEMPS